MWRSLRVRLVASYFLLSLLLLGVTGLVFSAALVEYAQREQTRQALARREQAAAYVNQAKGSSEELLGQLQRLFPDFEVAMAAPVPLYPIDLMAGQAVRIEALPVRAPLFFTLRSPSTISQFSIRYVQAGWPLAEYRFTQRPSWPALLRLFSPSVALILGVGVGFAALLGWWFSRWLSRPIASLSEATAAVAAGDFEQAVPPTGMRELDRLVAQFNEMSRQLQESFRSLAHERDTARRFAGDAAHELKTPITALRAYHEIAEARPERREQMLIATGRQIERLERIVGGLIRMATISDGVQLQLEPADLSDLVRQAEPSLRAEAESVGHRLLVDLAPVLALVEPDLFAMALTNLVENACKFTPPKGQIAIRLAEEEGEARLSVIDTGVGIAPEELPHIFERFHRGIDTQGIPGSGLGLALVKEAVFLMGGTASVQSAVGSGSCFTIHLPLYQPEGGLYNPHV